MKKQGTVGSEIGGGNVPDDEDSRGFAAAAAAVVCGSEEMGGRGREWKGRCGEEGGGGSLEGETSSGLPPIYLAVDLDRTAGVPWGPSPVDGDACLLRKQKRRFCFLLFFFRR